MLLHGNSYSASFNELQEMADCIAALAIQSADFQLKGNYKGEKLFRKFQDTVQSKFYDKLSEYREKNRYADIISMGQMPNRAIAKYNNMGDVQQIRYSIDVLKTNQCDKYF